MTLTTSVTVYTRVCGSRRLPALTKPRATDCSPGVSGCQRFAGGLAGACAPQCRHERAQPAPASASRVRARTRIMRAAAAA